LGIPRNPFFENLEPEIAKATEAALAVLRKLAGELKDVQIPASPGLGDVSNAEIYAYHAPWITKTPELYQEATRRIVQGGANAKAETYAQGLRRLELARREIAKTFASIDLLIMPTTGGTAGLIPAPQPAPIPTAAAPAGGAAGFRNTSYFSYYGLPALPAISIYPAVLLPRVCRSDSSLAEPPSRRRPSSP
jgi:aspartyl-tRNA(Asn)/glutamyl-tRNA(Gln) amidotransferase subunit A